MNYRKIEINDTILNDIGYFYIEKNYNNGYLLYDKDNDFFGITYLNGRLFQMCSIYYITNNRDIIIDELLNYKQSTSSKNNF